MKSSNSEGKSASANIVAVASVDDLRARIKRRGQLKGRQVKDAVFAEVSTLIGSAAQRADLLIEHLHTLNDRFGALQEEHLVALAKLMNLPMAQVYEVASFYHHFDILKGDDKAARLTVRVCDGLSCELAGAQSLLAQLPGLIDDAQVKVIAAPCLGRCEQAPVAVVHQAPVPNASPQSVLEAINAGRRNPTPAAADGQFEPAAFAQQSVTGATSANGAISEPYLGQVALSAQHKLAFPSVTPSYVGYAAYRARGGYALATAIATAQRSADELIKIMEDSGLRGLGGAGFPAGRKWRIVREHVGPRLMAVNIDEGEPGTFKDRTYLERDPHRFLEGMLIAAKVVGIDACYLYLRDEYHGCRDLLHAEIDQLRAEPPFALPTIELRRGAGAYICGEESAMIESIEGKRGEPRMRPPYIAQVGLFGRPTLEHNFETLYWVRDIVERGASWFSGFGRHGRRGLRSFSVSGRVKHPGVKLAPAGITVQELIDEYCGGMLDGHRLYAYLPGGASGGILPAHLNQIPLDFDTLQAYDCFIGSAAVIVLSQHDRARDAALNMMAFFAHESCGQCTPCRVGTSKAVQLMLAKQWDHATLDDLNQVMADASICGLGQAAPNPVRSVQKYFADEVA